MGIYIYTKPNTALDIVDTSSIIIKKTSRDVINEFPQIIRGIDILGVEDLSTYTIVDPNNRITVTKNLIDVNAIRRDEDAYVYKDKGVNHFTNFEHKVDVRSPTSLGSYGCLLVWGISNVIDDAYAWTYGFTIEIYGYDVTHYDIRMRSKNGTGGWGPPGSKSSTNKFTHGNWCYLTIKRSGTSLTCKIYSDSARGDLLETLTLTVGGSEKYRYIYACSSWNTASSQDINGDIKNFYLNE